MNGARNFGMLAAAAALFAVAGCATNDVGPCGDTAATYVVIDLSAGPEAARYPVRGETAAPDAKASACKTTELWLRRIDAGKMLLGSYSSEFGRQIGERLRTVTYGGYYIGVFEVTQRQWELVMGSNPSQRQSAMCPVERVSYGDIRGRDLGSGYPASDAVDAESFLGRLRERTGIRFDLPTEAQWEVACRAGERAALSNGKELTRTSIDPAVATLCRYGYNRTGDPKGNRWEAEVGSYAPNAWGIHDMPGNVCEWCADWMGALPLEDEAENPRGPETNARGMRMIRGGSWKGGAADCRSAKRSTAGRDYERFDFVGFRIAAPAR